MIVDIHTHFLPNMDDGPKDADTSRNMLKKAYSQGVSCVVATPHYYSDTAIDDFICYREKALKSVGDISVGYPEIRLWAEIAYHPSLINMDLKKLSLNNALLIELPFEAVSDNVIADLENIKSSHGLNIIIAHIERYDNFEKLFCTDFGLSINADSIFNLRLWKYLRKNCIDFISSDMHDLMNRPPNLCNSLDKLKFISKDAHTTILSNFELFYNGF